MTSGKALLMPTLFAAVAAVGLASNGSAEPPAVAVEISVEAAYAQGCVDCHDGTAVPTVGALLEEMGHPDVDEETGTLPGDCASCHSEEGGTWFLSEVAHMSHYREPATNSFVQDYGGDCRHCHVIDGETGAVSVKSGPKNW